MNYLDILTLIKSRQSLYASQMDSNQLISDENISKLLELANYAPSHKRTEPWRYVIFSNGKLEQLYLKLALLYKEICSKEEFNPIKYEKIVKKSNDFSHVIAICQKRDDTEKVPSFEEEYAVACSVQNMLLGMKSLNIIGYWSSPKMVYSNEFKHFLKLGEADKCMGLLQLGVPKKDLPEIPKQQISSINSKVRWF